MTSRLLQIQRLYFFNNRAANASPHTPDARGRLAWDVRAGKAHAARREALRRMDGGMMGGMMVFLSGIEQSERRK